MNKQFFNTNWNGFAVSIIGSSHINKELPCQDASLVIDSPRPAAIVCDGRGSAKLSHFGAQAAVKAFQTQLAVFEPMLATILDAENVAPERWDMFSRIIYRTLAQSKQNLVKEYNAPEITEREFDFTVACAITGKHHIGCFQVGDGAIVLRKNSEVFTVFEPDKGEFANQTVFLRENGEMQGKFKASFMEAAGVDGIAITSDGPECLMFKLPEMIPSGVFASFFDEMLAGQFHRKDLVAYLTRKKWSESYYGSDDRSVALLALQEVDAPSDQEDVFEESEAVPPETPADIESLPEELTSENPDDTDFSPEETSQELCLEDEVLPTTQVNGADSGKLKLMLGTMSLIAVGAICWGVSLHCQLQSFQKQLAVMQKSQQQNISLIAEQDSRIRELTQTCQRQKVVINLTKKKAHPVPPHSTNNSKPEKKETKNAGTPRSRQTQ